jgi:hypothetical protein
VSLPQFWFWMWQRCVSCVVCLAASRLATDPVEGAKRDEQVARTLPIGPGGPQFRRNPVLVLVPPALRYVSRGFRKKKQVRGLSNRARKSYVDDGLPSDRLDRFHPRYQSEVGRKALPLASSERSDLL